MDHLVENEGKSIPDLSSVSSSSTAPRSDGDVPMDEDDEDAEALRAVVGGAAANVAPTAADVEAKVRLPHTPLSSLT